MALPPVALPPVPGPALPPVPIPPVPGLEPPLPVPVVVPEFDPQAKDAAPSSANQTGKQLRANLGRNGIRSSTKGLLAAQKRLTPGPSRRAIASSEN